MWLTAASNPETFQQAGQKGCNVLTHLLSPRVQTRITDSRTYGNEYALNEMMSDLTSAIFDADVRGNVNSFRQNLQLEYVNRLSAIVKEPTNAPYDYISTQDVSAMTNVREKGSIQREVPVQPV